MKLTLDVAIEALKNEIICIENKHCVEGQYCDACQYEINDEDFINVLNFIIPILEKQEIDKYCETCKHERFGDEACNNCCVRFPNHYKAEEES